MSLKTRLARPAHAVERRVDRVLARFSRPDADGPVVETYMGYATPGGVVLRGRVLTASVQSDARERQRWWRNLIQMLKLFLTDEVTGARVECPAHDRHTVTDGEGYFTLDIAGDFAPGTPEFAIIAGGTEAICRVQVPKGDHGVISDIDDTVLQTGAWSLWRNLRTTLLGNIHTRGLFPDAARMIDGLRGDGPVFYVSSSPWNLHGFLGQIFDRNGLARGPMFLRDFGVDKGKLITSTHGDHKGSAIDTILSANPDMRFTLVGDTGQHDPTVYRHAAERHPGRIARVVLRAPGPGADPHDLAEAEAIRAMGIPVHVATDMTDLILSLAQDDRPA